MSEWTRPAQPVRCPVYLTDALTVRRERGALVQGDENANAIVAEVYWQKGVPYDLTGATVTLTFVRPDNLAVLPITAEITGENHNIAIATLTDTCYRYSGVYAASLKLHTGDTERTILKIIGDIISTENSGTVDDEQLFPTPEELLETLEQVETARQSAEAAAARANTAAQNANDKAGLANTAANNASAATNRANAAAQAIENLTVTSEDVGPDSLADAVLSDVNGQKSIHFRLRQGKNGTPYIIKGDAFNSIVELEAAITSPAIGDQYNVGTAPPYNVYRWTGTRWEDQGQISISLDKVEELLEIVDTFAKTSTIWRTIDDSSAEAICDSTGEPITGRVIFVQV